MCIVLSYKNIKPKCPFFFISGATGLGKSTMVNTLFKGRLSRMSSTGTAASIPKTVEVKSVSHGTLSRQAIFSLWLLLFTLCNYTLLCWGTWSTLFLVNGDRVVALKFYVHLYIHVYKLWTYYLLSYFHF